jgi:hypothetical protein
MTNDIMKIPGIPFLSLILLVLIASACKNKTATSATELAKDIQSAAKKQTPGTVPASKTGYYMNATIDGQAWAAAFMMPDDNASSSYKTLSGEKGDTYINFTLWKRAIAPGKSFPFGENDVANLSVEGVPGFWGGRTGEVKITSVEGEWLEGTFHFDANSAGSGSGRIIRVTNGNFRVPL